ncbi:MAG: carboxypeptidase-like regulatory domain-containing protein, partial [Actinomycetota bacterium]|nr:carboxypeptidase-like regulatory domain-containing protein [Actinomycetota bacterium]
LRQLYARAASVPAIHVGGQVVPLDARNLTDLRAIPLRDGGAFRFTLTTAPEGGTHSVTSHRKIPRSGLLVDAVHDLGGGLYAFVTHQLFNGGVPPGGRINTTVIVRSLTQATVRAYPYYHVELDEPGPATVGQTGYATEFSVPSVWQVAVGSHRTAGDFRAARRILSGTATVLRSPAPLTGGAPDQDASIAGRQVSVVIAPPASAPETPEVLAIFRAGLAQGVEYGPAFPPPLGERCGPPQITDLPTLDGAATSDILAAWFDDDPGTLYATIQLREVPTAPSSPTGDRYAVHWREDHEGHFARATLLPDGTWRFDTSFIGSGGFPVTGAVRPGPNGVIRIAVPRVTYGLDNGKVLRDPAAHAFVGTTTARADHAPKGSTAQFGLGPDYRIGGCRPVPVSLSFTDATPGSGRYRDAVRLEAALVDPNGKPVPGAHVGLSLEGTGSSWSARTGADGVASRTVTLDELPGTYRLVARFEGDPSYGAASVSRTFVIDRRPTAMALAVSGNGVKRMLAATLTDPAAGGAPVAGRLVEFFAGEQLIGAATTGDDGVARHPADVVPRGRRTYEARFGGDAEYGASSATASA